jgi:hypothetical protein
MALRHEAAKGRLMPIKIRNALMPLPERHRVEHAVREALDSGRSDLEAVITHAVDPGFAEVLILRSGQRCASYFVDLHRTTEELSIAIRDAVHDARDEGPPD